MKIIYDNLHEAAEAILSCEETLEKEKCAYCPLFGECQPTQAELRAVRIGTVTHEWTKEGYNQSFE